MEFAIIVMVRDKNCEQVMNDVLCLVCVNMKSSKLREKLDINGVRYSEDRIYRKGRLKRTWKQNSKDLFQKLNFTK